MHKEITSMTEHTDVSALFHVGDSARRRALAKLGLGLAVSYVAPVLLALRSASPSAGSTMNPGGSRTTGIGTGPKGPPVPVDVLAPPYE